MEDNCDEENLRQGEIIRSFKWQNEQRPDATLSINFVSRYLIKQKVIS